jgi:hypothetical protein
MVKRRLTSGGERRVRALLLHCYKMIENKSNCVCVYNYITCMIPLSFCMLSVSSIFVCVLSLISCNLLCFLSMYITICLFLFPSCQPPLTTHLHSLFLFQFLILLKLLLSGGNRLHVSIVPLNTPKPIKITHDRDKTTANAIQYVLTEYVTPRSADTYSVMKVSGRNRMVALLMSNATLVRRSTPADCDMATSWKFC